MLPEKITGLPRMEVVCKFREANVKLSAEGHTVFQPTVLPMYANVSHEDYMHICFAMIDICDAVYMLADWQQSIGARMERQYAMDQNKKILYEDETAEIKVEELTPLPISADIPVAKIAYKQLQRCSVCGNLFYYLRFHNFLDAKTYNYSCSKNICSKECFALDIDRRRKE